MDDFGPFHPGVQTCSGVDVRPGANVAEVINRAAPGTTFCHYAGEYEVTRTITMQDGDVWRGQPGTASPMGPASRVNAVVELKNPDPEGPERSLTRMVTSEEGANFRMDWIGAESDPSGYRTFQENNEAVCINVGPDYCPGNGTGVIMGFGKSGPDTVLSHLELRNAPSNCVDGISGGLLDSDLGNCSNDNYYGFQASAVKTISEAEFARNFVHGNRANGIWCDQVCRNTPSRENGFWSHDNVLVNNGQYGLRYEFSPMLAPGQVSAEPTMLTEHNLFAGNGLLDKARLGAGTSMHDAQNGFGEMTIGGVEFPNNENGWGIQFSDPPNSRTDTNNAEAHSNKMRGGITRIRDQDNPSGCYTDPPYRDRGVFCRDNTKWTRIETARRGRPDPRHRRARGDLASL